jgi:hypothetical protein
MEMKAYPRAGEGKHVPYNRMCIASASRTVHLPSSPSFTARTHAHSHSLTHTHTQGATKRIYR